jgi:hypothetical protein
MVEDSQRSELSKRLLALINLKLSQDKNFYASLEKATDVDRETWKHWYLKTSVVDPSSKLLTGAFNAWPQYAYWLATGMADERFGHLGVHKTDESPYAGSAIDSQMQRVRLLTELYMDSVQKLNKSTSKDFDHHLFMLENADKLRVQEVGKLCAVYLDGR